MDYEFQNLWMRMMRISEEIQTVRSTFSWFTVCTHDSDLAGIRSVISRTLTRPNRTAWPLGHYGFEVRTQNHPGSVEHRFRGNKGYKAALGRTAFCCVDSVRRLGTFVHVCTDYFVKTSQFCSLDVYVSTSVFDSFLLLPVATRC